MNVSKALLLGIAVAGFAFAGDIVILSPEAGVDGPAIASTIGIVTGGLLILRARRKK